MSLQKLIDRLEKAEHLDTELDGLVFEAAGGPAWERAMRMAAMPSGAPMDVCIRGARTLAPKFTSSITVAVTLVPDGWEWMVSNRAPKPHSGRAYINNRQLINTGIGGMTPNPKYMGYETTAATPAIALCIVGLRARAALLAKNRNSGGLP